MRQKKKISVHFVWALYCWVQGLPLNVVCIPSETPLKKINFSFLYECQLQKFLVRENLCPFLPPNWGILIWIDLIEALGLQFQSVWLHIYINPLGLEDTPSLETSNSHNLLNFKILYSLFMSISLYHLCKIPIL